MALLKGQTQYWHKIEVDYSVFATNNTLTSVKILDLPPRHTIESVIFQPTVDFTGGAITGYAISVGTISDLVFFSNAQADVFTTPLKTTKGTRITQVYDMSVSAEIYAWAESTNDDLDQAVTGRCAIYLLINQYPA